MKNGRANIALKEARKEVDLTQDQLSMNLFRSRESVSGQETGAYKVQPDTATYFAEQHNDPFVAIAAANEYTTWGISKLDGEAVDLHRMSVSSVTLEELEEATEAVHNASRKLKRSPNTIEPFDVQEIEKAIQESIDAITALTHYVAVLCKEYKIPWMRMWGQHKLKLISRRFLKS